MNLHPLIEAIVRQTTVLIAHLATVAGARATLAGTADQVFLNLAELSKLVPAAEPPMDRAIALSADWVAGSTYRYDIWDDPYLDAWERCVER